MSIPLRQLVAGLTPSGVTPSDEEALRRYADDHDPDSFVHLVRRFGPLVLGVCRRALGNSPDADDAFQATFLSLSQQANRVRRGAALPAWLHRVAVRTAAKVRAGRRPTPTLPDVAVDADPLDEVAWRDVRSALDEELDRLPEALRGPVVLCLLNGLTRDEAARALGYSLNTLKRRLDAGRELLRERLVRRGLGPAVAAVSVLSGHDGLRAAVPGVLESATAALAVGPRLTHAISGLWTVRRVWVGAILVIAATTVGVLTAEPPHAAPPPAAARPPAPPAAEDGDPVGPPSFFVWPLTTDLQRELSPPTRAAAVYVLIDATDAVAGGEKELNAVNGNIQSLPLKELRQKLAAPKNDAGLHWYVYFPHKVAFGGRAATGVLQRLVGFSCGLGYDAHNVTTTHWKGGPGDTWAEFRRSLPADEGRAERPLTTDAVSVYPVNTPLSRLLTHADCTVVVKPRLGPDDGDDWTAVRNDTVRLTAQLRLTSRDTIRFNVLPPDVGDARLDPLAERLGKIGSRAGFLTTSLGHRPR